MKKHAFRILLIPLVLALFPACAVAAKAKPKPKPQPKPQPKTAQSTHHETMGTQQLKGGFGEFGNTYTIGKDDPWNICLKSAEYSVNTIAVGDRIIFPKADEKLLVLHYTVHNPQKSEALMRFDTLRFTAVDAKDKNWEFSGDIGNEATKDNVDQAMKPAQKMDVFAVLAVPANGEIPKLIVQGSNDLVIRYDLRGKVKGLAAPFADPGDSTGATARAVVPAEYGLYYPLGEFAIKVEGTSFAEGAIGEFEPGENERLMVVSMAAKNLDKSPQLLRFDTIATVLRDADGAVISSTQDLYRASSDKSLDVNAEPGQEIKFRLLLRIEQGLEPKTMLFSNSSGEGRQFEYQVK
jgi:hypothetical protein